uniref:SET domain-containing protein n=1 Tax=Anopheles christyi TaxID=43041 RepID=A0A182JRS6_9DIPT
MDYLFENDSEFYMERGEDEILPEIHIVSMNSVNIEVLHKAAISLNILHQFEKQRRKQACKELESKRNEELLAKGSIVVQNSVFQCNDPKFLKLYLNFCSTRLQNSGKYRDSIRLLEAANAIVLENKQESLQASITLNLSGAYKRTGQYRKLLALDGCSVDTKSVKRNLKILQTKPFPVWQEEAACSALDWEAELFGTSNSRAVSCDTFNGHLVAKRDYNVGEVIFIDKPVVGYLAESKGQCNCCTMKTLYTVPMECLRKDEHYHKYECRGYELLFFPLVDIVLVLRMMVKSLDILEKNLSLRNQPTVQPQTAQQLWAALLEDHHAHSDDFLKILQGCTCNRFTQERATYQILIQKATLTLYYLICSKRLFVDYKHCWTHASLAERNIFLESVLLRLVCVAHSNACRFSYELAYDRADVDEIIMSRCSALDTHCAKNTATTPNANVPASSVCVPQRAAAYTRSENSLLMFWDVCWAEANHQAQTDDDLDVVECALKRYSEGYHSTFDFIEHLTQCETAPKVTTSNQYCGMYRFVQEIKFSESESNTIFILLDHGAVAFRAVKSIKKGEVLVCDHSTNKTDTQQQDSLNKQETKINIKGGNKTEEAVMLCKIDILSAMIINMKNMTSLYMADSFFEFLFVLDHFIRSKQSISMFKWINKIELIYQHARMIPLVLMQDEWMAQLVKRGPKLRLIQRTNNKHVATQLYNNFFK